MDSPATDKISGPFGLTVASRFGIFILFIFFYFSFSNPAFATPSYQWTNTDSSTSDGDMSFATTVDNSGNAYVTGAFFGTVDFDPSSGVDTRVTNGSADMFLSKYSSDGTYQWTKAVGGTSTEYGFDVVTDSSGNIYVTGWLFSSVVDFDPSVSIDNKTSNGLNDAYVTKYSSDGTYQWTKTVGGASYESAGTVAVNSSNNIYIAGSFNSTVDFDPSSNTDNKVSNGVYDSFISKYGSDGVYIWTKTLGGIGYDSATTIIFDSNNNLYIMGYFNNIVDFDPSSGTDNKTAQGSNDVFLSKYSSDGIYLWTKTFGGSSSTSGTSVITDLSGNIYISGTFQGTIDFNPSDVIDNHTSNGSYDIFFSKYSSNGTYQWTKTFGGSGSDYGYGGNDISVNRNDIIYLSGSFTSTVDFDPSSGVDNKTTNGMDDFFITSYNTDGTYRWTKTIGGTANDRELGIAVDNSDNILISGYFKNTVDFDFTDEGIDNHTSAGGSDIFIMKLFDDTTAPSLSLTSLTTPNSDTTPTLTGTATDVNGTISTVEYQMGSTSGSWTACTADDGAFDEVLEAFTCNPPALSVGSHTIYVRVTDSNGNTTLSGSESSDRFEIGEFSLDLAQSGVSEPDSSNTTVLGEKTVTSSDEVSVNWDRPADTSNIDEYVVHYREIGSSTWKTETAGPESDSISWDPGEGNWEWYLEIIYTDGSTSETAIYKFEVDQSSPENQLISIADEQMISLTDEQGTGLLLPFGTPLIFNFGNTDWDTVIEIWNWDKTIHYTTMVCGSGVCDHGDKLTGPLTLIIYTVDEAGNESERREIKITPFGFVAGYVSNSSVPSEPTGSAPSVTTVNVPAEITAVRGVTTQTVTSNSQLPANSSQLAPGIVRGAVDIDTSINPTAINNSGIVSGAVDFPQPESRPEPPRQNIFQRAWHSIFK